MTRVFTDYLLLGDSCLGCGRSPQLTADGHEKGTKSFARSSRPLTSIVGPYFLCVLVFFFAILPSHNRQVQNNLRNCRAVHLFRIFRLSIRFGCFRFLVRHFWFGFWDRRFRPTVVGSRLCARARRYSFF